MTRREFLSLAGGARMAASGVRSNRDKFIALVRCLPAGRAAD